MDNRVSYMPPFLLAKLGFIDKNGQRKNLKMKLFQQCSYWWFFPMYFESQNRWKKFISMVL